MNSVIKVDRAYHRLSRSPAGILLIFTILHFWLCLPSGWMASEREAWRDSWHRLRLQSMGMGERAVAVGAFVARPEAIGARRLLDFFSHRVPMMHVTCQQSTVHMPRNCSETMNPTFDWFSARCGALLEASAMVG